MPLYAATIALSAFLLFLVQPLIARQILPWFGGAAAVWATCLVFFQSMLLLGYAYADWVTRSLKPRTATALHVSLLVGSLVLLPIVPEAHWQPGADDRTSPSLSILALLAATVGLPYVLLSATSPLLQAWFWRRYEAGVPYRLFALSNFASLLALLAYPTAIETTATGAQQAWGWSLAYAAFVVLCASSAIMTLRRSRPGSVQAATATALRAGDSPRWSTRALWVAFAAAGSCLLLTVTNHLTQNIASVPFLWVLPLALYLTTFIVCFDHPRWYRRALFFAAAALLLPLMAWASESLDLHYAAPLYAAGLFVTCMICHGELYRLRPDPAHLTTFYLMIAVGGALGSALVGLGAPALLSGYYELGIVLVATAALLAWHLRSARAWVRAGAVAVCAATATFALLNTHDYLKGARLVVRNFYGVVRTRDFVDPVPFRVMFHGGINHGGQLLVPGHKSYPTTYFSLTSGYGRVFSSLPDRPRRIGVVGLGAGALAAYARKGDLFRFYEIDPQVAAVAVTEFSFLQDAPAQIDIVLGDGRLSLEREPPQRYDVLAIDAFSGDSIPTHLLTREAMAVYLRHLAPGGALVFQATNRFVDISPVVERLAHEIGLQAVVVVDDPAGRVMSRYDYWTARTDQIIVTANGALLAAEKLAGASLPLVPQVDFPVWTDDFHNLFAILRQ